MLPGHRTGPSRTLGNEAEASYGGPAYFRQKYVIPELEPVTYELPEDVPPAPPAPRVDIPNRLEIKDITLSSSNPITVRQPIGGGPRLGASAQRYGETEGGGSKMTDQELQDLLLKINTAPAPPAPPAPRVEVPAKQPIPSEERRIIVRPEPFVLPPSSPREDEKRLLIMNVKPVGISLTSSQNKSPPLYYTAPAPPAPPPPMLIQTGDKVTVIKALE